MIMHKLSKKKNPSTCSEKLPFMFGEVSPKDSPDSVGFAFCCLPEVKSKSLLLYLTISLPP